MNQDKRCFLFDLDGTITLREILPIIASEIKLETEMMLLTKLTIDGKVRFEDSFRLRFAILKQIPVNTIQEIVAEVPLSEPLLEFINYNRDRCFIVTGNLNHWIKPIIKRIHCKFFTSESSINSSQKPENLIILDKSKPALSLSRDFKSLVAIGDGYNDIPMFEVSNIGICYGKIHKPAQSLMKISNYVCHDERTLCRLLKMLS